MADNSKLGRSATTDRLREECEKRGLPVSLDVLMRHIENNHDAALGGKDSVIHSLRRKNDELAKALYDAELALSKIRTPGAVSLTTHRGGDRAPYVRDVAEAAMLKAGEVRRSWESMRRRLSHAD